jgi:hypothetical protein
LFINIWKTLDLAVVSFWSKTVLRITTYKGCGTPFFSFKITSKIISVHSKIWERVELHLKSYVTPSKDGEF